MVLLFWNGLCLAPSNHARGEALRRCFLTVPCKSAVSKAANSFVVQKQLPSMFITLALDPTWILADRIYLFNIF